MFAALLLATYSTFGPIAQTEREIFTATADGSTLQRIVKDAPNVAPFPLAESPYRIAAVDLDGDDVLFGTSVRERIAWTPIFPNNDVYQSATIELVDAERVHAIERVNATGGVPRTVIGGLRSVAQLAHDASWIYWLESSSGAYDTPAADAALRRIDKSGIVIETVASGLTIPYSNQHPFVLAGDDVYINSGDELLRVSKSGGPTRAVARTRPGSAIALGGGTIHYVLDARLHRLEAGSDIELGSMYPIQLAGATWADTLLGAAPGLLVAQVGWGLTGTNAREAELLGTCAPEASLRVIRLATGDRGHFYFVDPLSAPPTAIDDRGVWMRDHRVITFTTPPQLCTRRRTFAH
jgi:hypothetical protein